MIIRSWNLRPRPGRYDDAIGLITEGVKLGERHGARDVRLTQAATAGSTTGLLVLTCEFENLSAYGAYVDDTMNDVEAQSYAHRIREAEAPFMYESTAVLTEIDLGREDAKRGRGVCLTSASDAPCPGVGTRLSTSVVRRSTCATATGRWVAGCSNSTTPASTAAGSVR